MNTVRSEGHQNNKHEQLKTRLSARHYATVSRLRHRSKTALQVDLLVAVTLFQDQKSFSI